MNKFQEASKLERDKMTKILQENRIDIFSFTPDDTFERYDGIFINSKGKKIIFEVKNRAIPSDKFPTTIIEEHKYEFLINQTIGEPWLFVFFSDDVYLMEKIKESKNYNRLTIGAGKTTMGDQTMISKVVIEIPIIKSKLKPLK